MGFAHIGKAAVVVAGHCPIGWPAAWSCEIPLWSTEPYPPNWGTLVTSGGYSFAWPPGWPQSYSASYTLSVDIPASVSIGTPFLLVNRILKAGVDTADFLNHAIAVVASVNGVQRQVKVLAGDAWTDSAWYRATNYSGAAYGSSANIYVNLQGSDAGKTLTITAAVVTVRPAVQGSDTASISAAVNGSLEFSSATYAVNENAGTVTLTVKRVGGSNGAIGVTYTTSNGTALSGTDYTSTTNTLSWADLDVADKTFTVPITNRAGIQASRAFNVTLSLPTGGATLGSPTVAAVTINDVSTGDRGFTCGSKNSGENPVTERYTKELNTWSTKTSAPAPARQRLSSSPISGLIYIYGGRLPGSGTDYQDCDEYTPLSDAWASKTDMPAPDRAFAAAFTVSGRGYLCFGLAPDLRDCDEYNPGADSWASKTDGPLPARHNIGGAAVGSAGYLMYGTTLTPSWLSDCDEYTPGTDTWVSKTNGPAPTRSRPAAFAVGSAAYNAGGDFGADVADCDEYTPGSDSWVSKTDASLAFNLATASTIGSLGYVYGGHTSTVVASCREFNPSVNSWTDKADAPTTRSVHTASTATG